MGQVEGLRFFQNVFEGGGFLQKTHIWIHGTDWYIYLHGMDDFYGIHVGK